MTYVIAKTGQKLEDPCPQCWAADLRPFGNKYRCEKCGFLMPCCDGGDSFGRGKR
jgi:predicted RNA-binding Zn-ribbon protein involved in translation (DUF1610 family)